MVIFTFFVLFISYKDSWYCYFDLVRFVNIVSSRVALSSLKTHWNLLRWAADAPFCPYFGKFLLMSHFLGSSLTNQF